MNGDVTVTSVVGTNATIMVAAINGVTQPSDRFAPALPVGDREILRAGDLGGIIAQARTRRKRTWRPANGLGRPDQKCLRLFASRRKSTRSDPW